MLLGISLATIEQVLHIVDKYGITLVVAVVCAIILFVVLRDDRRAAKRKLIESDGVLVKNSLMADGELAIVMDQIITKYDPGWVTIWQFHNGITSVAGVPFLKISATNQSTQKNLYSFARDYTAIPASLMISPTSRLINGEFYYLNKECSTSNEWTRLMSVLQIEDQYVFPIQSLSGDLIGMLTLSYKDRHILCHEETDAIREDSARISVILKTLAKISTR